jgi:cycloartenol synthase
MYVTKLPIPSERREGMIQYLLNHQQVDGGWGTHIECASTMFGTVLSYVSLRLLGENATAPHMKLAHAFMMKYKGVLYAPSWAKFWLAVLGVYKWEGINSIPSEMWLLPRWFPFHPGKLWCHCRMVYLPMGYIYCSRYTPQDAETDPIIQSLRQELYEPSSVYHEIDFNAFRQTCAVIDEYSPLNPFMKVAQDFMSIYERFLLPKSTYLQTLRNKAQAFAIEYICAEDIQTNFIDIGPVNKSLNMLAVFVKGGSKLDDPLFKNHVPRIDDYLWVAEDGVKMQGYNGSQCWDTSFCVQAIVEGGLAHYYPECTRKIYHYLRRTQIACDEIDRDEWFRHQSKGGWPFSTAAHGWPISDCTSEGLKGVLSLHGRAYEVILGDEERISDVRLQDACDVLLSYHNADGGWATYENNRG